MSGGNEIRASSTQPNVYYGVLATIDIGSLIQLLFQIFLLGFILVWIGQFFAEQAKLIYKVLKS
ncbi:MAG: hypothetical protein ACP5I3_10300 [Thermoproteus sp.]